VVQIYYTAFIEWVGGRWILRSWEKEERKNVFVGRFGDLLVLRQDSKDRSKNSNKLQYDASLGRLSEHI
jgi:hypothetical protein